MPMKFASAIADANTSCIAEGGRQVQPSAMFRTFCDYFGLDATQASTWRTALSAAQSPAAQSWGRDVLAFDLEPPHGREKFARVVPFFRQVSPPARVVAVLESLVEERLLTRREATQIEEKVFACLDAQGEWCWDA
jgi:hypothetical protein